MNQVPNWRILITCLKGLSSLPLDQFIIGTCAFTLTHLKIDNFEHQIPIIEKENVWSTSHIHSKRKRERVISSRYNIVMI